MASGSPWADAPGQGRGGEGTCPGDTKYIKSSGPKRKYM